MYLGSSAESSKAFRSFLMAVLMPWSNSTTVSLGHSFFLISSRVTSSPPALDQDQQDLATAAPGSTCGGRCRATPRPGGRARRAPNRARPCSACGIAS